MTDVLPSHSGLVVNGVIYRYKVIKQESDDMVVGIQNQDALGSGLIFRSVDDWSGLRGNTITKSVPVENIPLPRWGAGEIDIQGVGSVVDPTVIYTYRYNTCDEPLNDPRCPGYDSAMSAFLSQYGIFDPTVIDDPMDDENVKNALANNNTDIKEEDRDDDSDKEEDEEDEDKKRERRRIGLMTADETLFSAQAIAQAALIESMNNIPSFNNYLSASMSGGTYVDTLRYEPKTIPDNKQARRVGLAQQILHDRMVDDQYQLVN